MTGSVLRFDHFSVLSPSCLQPGLCPLSVMNLDRVREKLANGFRPFVLELFGGQRVRVVHPELGQHSSTPFQLLSLANCTTNSSTDRSRRGRPRVDRCLEPSNFLATSFRCQARIVSGRTIRATSSSALRPKRWPILARVMRSASLRRSRPLTWFLRMRFSSAKYSFRVRSFLSTEPVI